MKRLLALVVLVAACATTSVPSPETSATLGHTQAPTSRPSNALVQTLPPSHAPMLYDRAWLVRTCEAMELLGTAVVGHRAELEDALTLDDYGALNVIGESMYYEVAEAEAAIKEIPAWEKAEKLQARLEATVAKSEEAAISIAAGGRYGRFSRIEEGVVFLGTATELMAATTRMFTSMGDTYDFTCRDV